MNRHLTEQEKKQYFDHLDYEVRMFKLAYVAWIQAEQNPTLLTDFLRNTVLESFLLHARNLIEFLTKKPSNSREYRDISALDYGYVKYSQDKELVVRAEEISQKMAHNTERRIKGLVKWPLDKIYEQVYRGIGDFYEFIGRKLPL